MVTSKLFFMIKAHQNCIKTQRRYLTCDCVMFEIRKLIRGRKKAKGLKKYNLSDFLDDLVLEEDEVFNHA
jgi:hypothetical protein